MKKLPNGTLLKKFIVLLKTRRTSMFIPPAVRSKYIGVPKNLIVGGHHFVEEFFEGIEVNVPTSIGFLHHYRTHTPESSIHTADSGQTVVDRTMHKYKDRLLSNVNRVLSDISHQCNLS